MTIGNSIIGKQQRKSNQLIACALAKSLVSHFCIWYDDSQCQPGLVFIRHWLLLDLWATCVLDELFELRVAGIQFGEFGTFFIKERRRVRVYTCDNNHHQQRPLLRAIQSESPCFACHSRENAKRTAHIANLFSRQPGKEK